MSYARCLWLLATLTFAADHAELVGKVVGVHDGDTLTLLVDGRTQYKVRLDGIDAPELGQDFGTRAKQALSKAIFGKTVRIETHGQDRYGRTLGEVFDGAESINRRLVLRRHGLALRQVFNVESTGRGREGCPQRESRPLVRSRPHPQLIPP
jgi:endonuclease YncB( thermonuclease family)